MRFGSSKTEETNAQIENGNALEQACEELGRSDLYEPLSWVIALRPHWADEYVEGFLKDKQYTIAANAKLYESKLAKAKEYFELALKAAPPNSDRYRHLSIVLANLDAVSEIAHKSWELDGRLTTKS